VCGWGGVLNNKALQIAAGLRIRGWLSVKETGHLGSQITRGSSATSGGLEWFFKESGGKQQGGKEGEQKRNNPKMQV
jgi:antirestriction protein ArdC